MQRNEIIEMINQKTLEAKKLIDEINELKKILSENKKTKAKDLTDEEIIKVFMNYFKGRDDVYPYLSIDKKDSNKKYYIPKCTNEWKKVICNKTIGKKCKDCQYWISKPQVKDMKK